MFRPTGLTLRAAPPKERDHLLDGAATPPLPRSIQSCPAGQRQNTQETAPSKTKDLSAQFLERGLRLSRRLSQTPFLNTLSQGTQSSQRRPCFRFLYKSQPADMDIADACGLPRHFGCETQGSAPAPCVSPPIARAR